MWTIIKLFLKKQKYYIKIKVNDKDVKICSFGDLFSMVDGKPNEIILADVSGDIQVILGER